MGKILNIQRFCTSDGPGIRTTVFLKGCPLRCAWCHNPESQGFENEMSYNAERCLSCGRCVSHCPNHCHKIINGVHVYDRSACTACKKCVHPVCPAMEAYGYEAGIDEILDDVIRDEAFYQSSGGGLTLSGGEPLAQADFCLSLLQAAKERGLHICMETCGHVKPEILKKSTAYVDLYLFDYKETNAEKHKAYTGADPALILDNLGLLDRMGKQIILRCPIVPGFNDTSEHFDGIARIANERKSIQRIELEPYHDLGCSKYVRLGKELSETVKNIPVPDRSRMQEILRYIGDRTDTRVVLA